MALEQWLPYLTGVMQKAVSGVQAAYTFNNLPASLSSLPCFVVMPQRGSQDFGGANTALYDIQAILYTSPANLPEAYKFCVGSVDKVRRAIARNIKLGGLVDHCTPVDPPASFFEIGAITSLYGDKAYIGVIYHLTVKETGDIEFKT